MLIDQAVVQRADVVVVRIGRLEDGARKLAAELR